jgi:hypothetical protein
MALGDPLRVSTAEIFMLDWVPRHALLDPEQTTSLPEVFTTWAGWVADERDLPDRLLDDLFDATTDLTVPFFERIASGEGRSAGASILAGMLNEGVDLNDPEALQAAVDRHNASLGSDAGRVPRGAEPLLVMLTKSPSPAA